MADSIFTAAMNVANTAFGAVSGETFTIPAESGILGNPGTYAAVNIDDISALTLVAPGGSASDISVNVFIKRDVLAASGVRESTKMIVRGKRVRVIRIGDDGDNTLTLVCGPTSVSIKI